MKSSQMMMMMMMLTMMMMMPMTGHIEDVWVPSTQWALKWDFGPRLFLIYLLILMIIIIFIIIIINFMIMTWRLGSRCQGVQWACPGEQAPRAPAAQGYPAEQPLQKVQNFEWCFWLNLKSKIWQDFSVDCHASCMLLASYIIIFVVIIMIVKNTNAACTSSQGSRSHRVHEPPTKTNSKLASMLKSSFVRRRLWRRRRRDEEEMAGSRSLQQRPTASTLRSKVGGDGEGGERWMRRWRRGADHEVGKEF